MPLKNIDYGNEPGSCIVSIECYMAASFSELSLVLMVL
jgi:hypothetical protein